MLKLVPSLSPLGRSSRHPVPLSWDIQDTLSLVLSIKVLETPCLFPIPSHQIFDTICPVPSPNKIFRKLCSSPINVETPCHLSPVHCLVSKDKSIYSSQTRAVILNINLSNYLSILTFICVIYLYIYLSIYLYSIYLSIYLSIYPSINCVVLWWQCYACIVSSLIVSKPLTNIFLSFRLSNHQSIYLRVLLF